MAASISNTCTDKEIIHLARAIKWNKVEIGSKIWNEFLSGLSIVKENKINPEELAAVVENCATKAMDAENYDIALMLMAQHIDDFYFVSSHHGDKEGEKNSSILEERQSYAEETENMLGQLQKNLKHPDCVAVWVYCYAAMAYVYEIKNPDSKLMCETYLHQANEVVDRNHNNCPPQFIHERALLNNCWGRYYKEISSKTEEVSLKETERALKCFDNSIADFHELHKILTRLYGEEHDHFYRDAGLARIEKIQYLLNSVQCKDHLNTLNKKTLSTIQAELSTVRRHLTEKPQCLSDRLKGLIETAEAEWHLKFIQTQDVEGKSDLAMKGLGHAENARRIFKDTNFKEKQFVETLIEGILENISLRELYNPDIPMKCPTGPLNEFEHLQKNLGVFLERQHGVIPARIQRVYIDLYDDAKPCLVVDVSKGNMESAREIINNFLKNPEFARYTDCIQYLEQETIPVDCVRCGDEIQFLQFLQRNVELRQTVGGFPKALGCDDTYCLTTAHGIIPGVQTHDRLLKRGEIDGVKFKAIFNGVVGKISRHPADANVTHPDCNIKQLAVDVGVFLIPRAVHVPCSEKFLYMSMFAGNVVDLCGPNKFVRKRGAVTAYTAGKIDGADAHAQIIHIYPVVAGSIFAAAGDSGAIVYTERNGERQAIGLVTQIQRVNTLQHPNGIDRTYAVLIRNCLIALEDYFNIRVQIVPSNRDDMIVEPGLDSGF